MPTYKRFILLFGFVSMIVCAVESGAASFPIYLKGTAPEQASVTVNVIKPAGVANGIITIKAFDADNAKEGDLVVNGNTPVALWGASGASSNNQRWANITFKTPASYWKNGSNTLLFKHKKSGGFVIESVKVSFSGASSASNTSSSTPIVKFSANGIDFGSLDVGGISNPKLVSLSNTGSAPLVISALYATSNNFTQKNNCNNYLPIGGKCNIYVTFIPTTSRAYAETLTVLSNAAGGTHTVSLTGIGNDGTQVRASSAGNTIFHVDFENRQVNSVYSKAQIIDDFNASEKDGVINGPSKGHTTIVSDPGFTGRGKVLRIRHPAGQFSGGVNFKARFARDNQNKSGSARFDDTYLAYDIYLSPNTKRMPYHKLPGLITGTLLEASHAANKPAPEGVKSFTALMATFTSKVYQYRPDGSMALYFYDAQKVQKSDFLDTRDPKKETVSGSYAQPKGVWITIEQRVKLNTADSKNAYSSSKDLKNGLAEVWINGVKMSSKVHLWRHTNTMKADGFWFLDQYNKRPDLISPPSKDQYVYYDNFRVSTSPITH